jgi:hypothetical protein
MSFGRNVLNSCHPLARPWSGPPVLPWGPDSDSVEPTNQLQHASVNRIFRVKQSA